MIRTKKKTIKMKSIAICLALLIVISVGLSIFNVVFAENNVTLDFGDEIIENGAVVYNVNGQNVPVKLVTKNNTTNLYEDVTITSGNKNNISIDLDAHQYYLYVDRTNNGNVRIRINDATYDVPGDNYFGLNSNDFRGGVLVIHIESNSQGEQNQGGQSNVTLDFGDEIIENGAVVYNVNGQNVPVKLVIKNNNTINSYDDVIIPSANKRNMSINLSEYDYYLYIDRTNNGNVQVKIDGIAYQIPGDSYFGLNADDYQSSVLGIRIESNGQGGSEEPPVDPGTGGENQPPVGPNSEMQIWLDDVTGEGFEGAVIDDKAPTPVTSYTGTGFKINKGRFHSIYELVFTAPNVTAPAIRLEGNGILTIVPYSNETEPDTVYTSKIDSISDNNSNGYGYSIFSEIDDSNIYVETMQGEGKGRLALSGGVSIKGGFGASDHDVQIGSTVAPSIKGIKAKDVIVDYAELKMYCTGTLFEGITIANQQGNPETKMDGIDVNNTAKLIATTTLATGTALNNVEKLSVLSGGEANITCTGGATIGTLEKKAQYYDFVNFETTQSLDEMATEFENIKTINAVAPGDGKYYSMTETSTTLHLTSLSKALYTLSYNMTDFNGEIVEDTRVAHGTVRVKTACGIGFGANGRTCNDFRIEQGTPVTIELLPDYGYQFISGSLNGTAITTAQEGVATYQFNMPANHLHLSAIFTPVEDSIVIDNDEIVGASIGNLAGQINGNAEFKVETAEDVEEDKFNEAADGATIVGFTELSLNQVVLKGNETDFWKTGITDLEEPMNVSLKVSDEMAAELAKGDSVGVLRDHNGEVTLIEATYDKDTQKLNFSTDGYSTYAIIYSAKATDAKSENKTETETETETNNSEKDETVKTGDVILLVAIPTIILVVVANIMVTNRKRNFKKRK